MEVIALDTNQAIAVLNGIGDIGNWITQFQTIYLPVPVIGELRFGALNSQNAAANQQRVDRLISKRQALEITPSTADVYARIRLQLKRIGRPIPENDLWIAAICKEHDIPLATDDKHFLAVESLHVVER